jgi:hypothetical protein
VHVHPRRYFIVAIALTALGAATLHGVEATAWAVLYIWLGAMSDLPAAMLYSLSAITSYGHAEIFLEDRWKLLGARGNERPNSVRPDLLPSFSRRLSWCVPVDDDRAPRNQNGWVSSVAVAHRSQPFKISTANG